MNSELEKSKSELISYYKRNKYATDERTFNAFFNVPREEFVLEKDRIHAYDDHPLPILKDQTISAPHMCVLILGFADFKPGQKVLEIGSGSGYQAALISEMVSPEGFVYGIERHNQLAEFGMMNLEKTGYSDKVLIIAGDGTLGWPEADIPPFDRIIITAAGPQIPPPLIDQLKVGGKLYMPFGDITLYQHWIEVEKIGEGEIRRKNLTEVRFVPLIGKHGAKDDYF